MTAVVSLQQDCDLANWGVDFPALQWRAGELGISLERCPVRPPSKTLLLPRLLIQYPDGQVYLLLAKQSEVACRACVTRIARMAVVTWPASTGTLSCSRAPTRRQKTRPESRSCSKQSAQGVK